jgi:hypothetical protein
MSFNPSTSVVSAARDLVANTGSSDFKEPFTTRRGQHDVNVSTQMMEEVRRLTMLCGQLMESNGVLLSRVDQLELANGRLLSRVEQLENRNVPGSNGSNSAKPAGNETKQQGVPFTEDAVRKLIMSFIDDFFKKIATQNADELVSALAKLVNGFVTMHNHPFAMQARMTVKLNEYSETLIQRYKADDAKRVSAVSAQIGKMMQNIQKMRKSDTSASNFDGHYARDSVLKFQHILSQCLTIASPKIISAFASGFASTQETIITDAQVGVSFEVTRSARARSRSRNGRRDT